MTRYLDVGCALGEKKVIFNNVLQLREMPGIPLTNTHCKCIDIFVHLIEQCNRLNDHIICSARIEFNLTDECT